MSPSNSAAWLITAKAKPLEVKPAPYTSPGPHEIVIKNAAVAINPADWVVQDIAPFPNTPYPAVLGFDTAGEVIEVGSSVTRFSVGDRVLGLGIFLSNQSNAHATFQHYTVVPAVIAAPIPSTLSFEDAAVIPLGLATAACGLFQKDYLALEYPSLDPKPNGKVLIIWGGSSSLGSNGIQLAVAAGYEVFVTASPKNFDYVKKLGASQAFDYNSETVVDELVEALKGREVAGAFDCIGKNGAVESCAAVLRRSEGNRFVAIAIVVGKMPEGVKSKVIWGDTLKDNEVGKIIFEDYIPHALAQGKFVPAPPSIVVGQGLEEIQKGVDVQRKGVSAQKVVITL